MEAQRDRAYFKHVLQARGEKGLRDEMLVSMARQADRPQLDVAVSRNGRAVGAAAAPSPDHIAQFAFLRLAEPPRQYWKTRSELRWS